MSEVPMPQGVKEQPPPIPPMEGASSVTPEVAGSALPENKATAQGGAADKPVEQLQPSDTQEQERRPDSDRELIAKVACANLNRRIAEMAKNCLGGDGKWNTHHPDYNAELATIHAWRTCMPPAGRQGNPTTSYISEGRPLGISLDTSNGNGGYDEKGNALPPKDPPFIWLERSDDGEVKEWQLLSLIGVSPGDGTGSTGLVFIAQDSDGRTMQVIIPRNEAIDAYLARQAAKDGGKPLRGIFPEGSAAERNMKTYLRLLSETARNARPSQDNLNVNDEDRKCAKEAMKDAGLISGEALAEYAREGLVAPPPYENHPEVTSINDSTAREAKIADLRRAWDGLDEQEKKRHTKLWSLATSSESEDIADPDKVASVVALVGMPQLKAQFVALSNKRDEIVRRISASTTEAERAEHIAALERVKFEQAAIEELGKKYTREIFEVARECQEGRLTNASKALGDLINGNGGDRESAFEDLHLKIEEDYINKLQLNSEERKRAEEIQEQRKKWGLRAIMGLTLLLIILEAGLHEKDGQGSKVASSIIQMMNMYTLQGYPVNQIPQSVNWNRVPYGVQM